MATITGVLSRISKEVRDEDLDDFIDFKDLGWVRNEVKDDWGNPQRLNINMSFYINSSL